MKQTSGCWLFPPRKMGKKEVKELIKAHNQLVNATHELVSRSKQVEADITDQDTGWFYQWKHATDKADQTINNTP